MFYYYPLLFLICAGICAGAYSMDDQRALQQAEFWDIIDIHYHQFDEIDRHRTEIKKKAIIQRYFDEKIVCLPINRKRYLTAAFWSAIFVPPIIASQRIIQTQLASLSEGLYLAGAGLVTVWTIYEIKQLIELLHDVSDQDDILAEIFD